jgi:nicotinamidase-related amidase
VPDAFGLSVPTRLEEVCRPSKIALIIYDMQVGIVSQISDGNAVAERCQALLTGARAGGYRIYFMRHMWLPNKLAGIGQFRRAMVWQRANDPMKTTPPFARGSAPWQIIPELAPNEDECVIDKITMSAFEGTFLDIALRDAQLTSFIIAGIALEVGIGPTVRHGADLNYIPIVVTDACRSKTVEAKNRTLEELDSTGEVFTVESEALLPLLSESDICER